MMRKVIEVLQNLGLKVGILDADVYGPSLPKLIKLNEKPKSEDGKALVPLEKYDAQCMSMGFLVDEQTPMIWRGPMVISALKTMTQKVLWKYRDVIVIDMPPGTGDTQLTFAQEVKVDGAIIVSTPQDVALIDAVKAAKMFTKVEIDVLGIVENMSFFACPKCGEETPIFNRHGAEEASKKIQSPFLGAIPIELEVRKGGDDGKPLMASNLDTPASMAFKNIADNLVKVLEEG